MRILHAIDSVNPNGGGPIEGIKQLASVSLSRGHVVDIASMDPPNSEFVKTCPLPVHTLGPPRGKYSYSPRFVPWMRENAAKYDIVVVNGIWQYQLFGTWLALRESSTPYVVFSHGMLDPWFKRNYPMKHVKKWMYWPLGGYLPLRAARAVVFTCDEERILARQSFWLYKAQEAVISYGTAGPPITDRDFFLSRYPELQSKRLALYMGRLHEKKGCDILLRAFAESLAKDASWQLVMAGPDQSGLQSKLTSLASSLGIKDRVTWTGMLSGETKWSALSAAEVFVLPSHQENFGIVVAEALACGVPVLISDKVNIWREIRQDKAGLVGNDDLQGTTSVLKTWARMPDHERLAMSANARPCFLRRFEIHTAADTLLSLLATVAHGSFQPRNAIQG